MSHGGIAARGPPRPSDPPSERTWGKQLLLGPAQPRGSLPPGPLGGGEYRPLGTLAVEFPRFLALATVCVSVRGGGSFHLRRGVPAYSRTIPAAFAGGFLVYLHLFFSKDVFRPTLVLSFSHFACLRLFALILLRLG